MQPVVEYRRALHRIPELDDRLRLLCSLFFILCELGSKTWV